ncbi:dTDP-4-dehydrorhamnose 3,5-epimerase [Oleiphilus messinensis]|uniref:dTDP-4-dehydrorhamnose 3,5-epimerase n=1 Tax=Oleiphilus messinensis TaxID=141451 RepID=A0A1Y0I9X5_9GAMM|nr:dTDP-4-dehydrorhamnose 3,5-epimerase [Oleiphilus messinensis]ARU56193.1 dTDP-4-dehydrorhamnose 3,5-epimerase [Oleiphilus messinensis]
MNVIETALPGVLIIEPNVFGDSRGFFLESYQATRYQKLGIDLPFVQDNHSRSARGVLRGLHFQVTKPQGKLVRVVSGEILDVVVDFQPGSETFGRYEAVVLSAENHRQLYVPPGYAHGFAVISESADFLYKCTDYYDPSDEAGIIWNDPLVNVAWPFSEPLLSEKDRHWPTLEQYVESLS